MGGSHAESLNRLMAELARMPGIGEKTAERCAYWILKTPREEALKLARAIQDVKTNILNCSICHNVSEREPCSICGDAARDAALVCVVEQPRDLVAMEKAGIFGGRYHVLLGALNPLEGVRPEDLTVRSLRERLAAGGIREVIIATNPTLEGDATARLVQDALAGMELTVTRIARGIPSGTSLEYVNTTILSEALEGRRPI